MQAPEKARLFRFRDHDEFQRLYPRAPGLLARFEVADNLLVIDGTLFDGLAPMDQSEVLRAEVDQWIR